MKDYYQILRVPPDASPEQIKHVYRKLALIYAPDTTELDKAHATEEMKELNEANAVLSDPLKRAEYDRKWKKLFKQSTPIPDVSLTRLDFGALQIGRKETLKFTVYNRGAIPQEINFVCSEENGWFTISSIKPSSSKENPFPIEVDVTADTGRLAKGDYQGWIEVNFDGVTARTDLSIRVMIPSTSKAPTSRQLILRQIPGWAVVSMALVGVVFSGWLALSSFGLLPGKVSTPTLPTLQLINPTPLPVVPSGQIVFSRIKDSQQILHRVNVEGTNEHSLDVAGWSPVWSPDGRQIAFISDRSEGVQQVYLVKPEGGSLTRLTEMDGNKSALTWSENGDSLVFVATVDYKSTIYIVDVLGIKVQPVTEEQDGEITQITWSSDGKRLLFDVQSGDERRVYRLDTDSKQELQLSDFDSWQPAWSPNGKEIAVASEDGIYKMDEDGQKRLRLTTFPAWSPAWSSDGHNRVLAGVQPD